jgi:hypothetical protein
MSLSAADDTREAVAQLEALATDLAGRNFEACATSNGDAFNLNVINPTMPSSREVVAAALGDDGEWWFWWSWGGRIARITDVEEAAFKIAYVLTPQVALEPVACDYARNPYASSRLPTMKRPFDMTHTVVAGTDELRNIFTRLQALEDEFPEWHCWRSDHGWLWATRRGRTAQHTPDDRRPMTVDGADVARLREQIRQHSAFANGYDARF